MPLQPHYIVSFGPDRIHPHLPPHGWPGLILGPHHSEAYASSFYAQAHSPVLQPLLFPAVPFPPGRHLGKHPDPNLPIVAPPPPGYLSPMILAEASDVPRRIHSIWPVSFTLDPTAPFIDVPTGIVHCGDVLRACHGPCRADRYGVVLYSVSRPPTHPQPPAHCGYLNREYINDHWGHQVLCRDTADLIHDLISAGARCYILVTQTWKRSHRCAQGAAYVYHDDPHFDFRPFVSGQGALSGLPISHRLVGVNVESSDTSLGASSLPRDPAKYVEYSEAEWDNVFAYGNPDGP